MNETFENILISLLLLIFFSSIVVVIVIQIPDILEEDTFKDKCKVCFYNPAEGLEPSPIDFTFSPCTIITWFLVLFYPILRYKKEKQLNV